MYTGNGLALGIVLLCWMSPARGAEPFEMGSVSQIGGKWQDGRSNPTASVVVGTHVWSDSKLRRVSGRSSADFLLIQSYFRKDKIGHDENVPLQCSEPTVCPDRDDNTSYIDVRRLEPEASPFFDWLRHYWVPAISWSVPSKEHRPTQLGLADGVVVVANGTANFDVIFRGAPKGDYEITWCRESSKEPVLPSTADCSPAKQTISVTDGSLVSGIGKLGSFGKTTSLSTPQRDKPLYVGGLSEGTYVMHVVAASTTGAPQKDSLVVVAATTGERRASVAASYREAIGVAAHWDDKDRAEGAKLAYLYYLSAGK